MRQYKLQAFLRRMLVSVMENDSDKYGGDVRSASCNPKAMPDNPEIVKHHDHEQHAD